MTGLRTLDIFMHFLSALPSLDGWSLVKNLWLVALFDLQKKLRVVRSFQVDRDSQTRTGKANEDELRKMKAFEKAVRRRLSELMHAPRVSQEKLEV